MMNARTAATSDTVGDADLTVVWRVAALATMAIVALALGAALTLSQVAHAQETPVPPPPGYYDAAAGKTGSELRAALHDIVDDQKDLSDDRLWEAVIAADQSTTDTPSVLTWFWNGLRPKNDHSDKTGWERSHLWPKSYGYGDMETCNLPLGDAHQVVAEYPSYNSSLHSEWFDWCLLDCEAKPVVGHPDTPNLTDTDSWEVWPGRRGDVARALLYMDVRYDGTPHGTTGCAEPDLRLTDDTALIKNQDGAAERGYMGLLSVLLQWHVQDLVDKPEERRNGRVYLHQFTATLSSTTQSGCARSSSRRPAPNSQ